jgi:polar amino acid transport system substrate-binding protein
LDQDGLKTMKLTFGNVLLTLLVLLACGCEKDAPRRDAAPPKAEAASAPASTAGNLERVQQAKALRIGIKSDAPPFCFQDKDGNPQGFDVDLGFRLARSLGAQPVFVFVTPAERIEKLRKGELDVVIATLTATRRRAREIDFSMPYFQDQQGLLVKADSPIKSYRDLAGKKVVAAEGTTSQDNIKIVAPDAQITPVPRLAQGFAKLQSGEADALTGDGLQLQALRLSAPDPGQYKLAGDGFSVELYVIGVPQNDSVFRNKVDEALTELWNSGVWTRLFNKWLGAESPYQLEAHFQMPVLPP